MSRTKSLASAVCRNIYMNEEPRYTLYYNTDQKLCTGYRSLFFFFLISLRPLSYRYWRHCLRETFFVRLWAIMLRNLTESIREVDRELFLCQEEIHFFSLKIKSNMSKWDRTSRISLPGSSPFFTELLYILIAMVRREDSSVEISCKWARLPIVMHVWTTAHRDHLE